uniref:C2H2-type domain-containing protein n=1 Tax=viral metagenome TaxID=1070528 RepID=A0A6C0HKE4_9ZZZZ
METKYHCDSCNSYFTRKYFLTEHLKSKKHINRKNEPGNRSASFECGCGKRYLHKKSLEFHKKNCTSPPSVKRLDVNEVIQKESKEELKKIKEEIQQELEKIKVEMRKIKKEKVEPAVPKSRDIRKQIKKETRKEVVDDQQNKCGRCEEELSSCFQIDHIVGIQFGGTNEKSNLMALCCECHARKSIAENKCRQQIKEAIQNILKENMEETGIFVIRDR